MSATELNASIVQAIESNLGHDAYHIQAWHVPAEEWSEAAHQVNALIRLLLMGWSIVHVAQATSEGNPVIWLHAIRERLPLAPEPPPNPVPEV